MTKGYYSRLSEEDRDNYGSSFDTLLGVMSVMVKKGIVLENYEALDLALKMQMVDSLQRIENLLDDISVRE